MRVVVLGASGFTGQRVCAELSRRSVPFVPAGRDLRRLAAVATLPQALPPARADARDPASLAAAFRGADVVVNLAGPFTRAGEGPAEAAVGAGVPYLDSTGEQSFMLRLRARLDRPAREAGVALASAFAYEYALGDAAARLALGQVDRPTALHVLYRTRHARASAGTKRSVVRVVALGGVARVDGRERPEGAAAATRRFATRDGPRDAASFPGGEALHVARWAPVPTVRTYATMRPGKAAVARLLAPAARIVLRGPLLAAAERAALRAHRDPSPDELARMTYEVVAEVDTPAGVARRALAGVDPYAATARLLAEGADRLAHKSWPAGFVAPTEVLPAERIAQVVGATVT